MLFEEPWVGEVGGGREMRRERKTIRLEMWTLNGMRYPQLSLMPCSPQPTHPPNTHTYSLGLVRFCWLFRWGKMRIFFYHHADATVRMRKRVLDFSLVLGPGLASWVEPGSHSNVFFSLRMVQGSSRGMGGSATESRAPSVLSFPSFSRRYGCPSLVDYYFFTEITFYYS